MWTLALPLVGKVEGADACFPEAAFQFDLSSLICPHWPSFLAVHFFCCQGPVSACRCRQGWSGAVAEPLLPGTREAGPHPRGAGECPAGRPSTGAGPCSPRGSCRPRQPLGALGPASAQRAGTGLGPSLQAWAPPTCRSPCTTLPQFCGRGFSPGRCR